MKKGSASLFEFTNKELVSNTHKHQVKSKIRSATHNIQENNNKNEMKFLYLEAQYYFNGETYYKYILSYMHFMRTVPPVVP